MTFPEACEALSKGREFMALLPNGPQLVLSARLELKDMRAGKPRRYVGKFSDYVSIEWRVFTREQLQRLAQQAAAERQG
jgi:hypothetical protein